MNTSEQVKTYAVEAIVKVPNYRGKHFRGITKAQTEDEARALTRTTLFNSLRRAIIGLEMRNIKIHKVSFASDFCIESNPISIKNK